MEAPLTTIKSKSRFMFLTISRVDNTSCDVDILLSIIEVVVVDVRWRQRALKLFTTSFGAVLVNARVHFHSLFPRDN